MYMLFVRFENYTYYHLHSTWEGDLSAVKAGEELLKAKNTQKVVSFKICEVSVVS